MTRAVFGAEAIAADADKAEARIANAHSEDFKEPLEVEE